MNWLAHLHLSEDNVEFRLGNVIADFIKGERRLALPERIRRGIACHMFIDRFTDAHPVFLRSRQRVAAPRRRFASIVIDVFYDHYLSQAWERFSNIPRRDFIQGVYIDFERYTRDGLPDARRFVTRMAEDDWLGDYASLDGISRTLARVSGRLNRPGLLSPMIDDLTANYEALSEDFEAYYPELCAAVAGWAADAP